MSLVIVTIVVLMAVINSEIFSLLVLTVGAALALGRFFMAIAEHGEW